MGGRKCEGKGVEGEEMGGDEKRMGIRGLGTGCWRVGEISCLLMCLIHGRVWQVVVSKLRTSQGAAVSDHFHLRAAKV
jgi:hypothetical protein